MSILCGNFVFTQSAQDLQRIQQEYDAMRKDKEELTLPRDTDIIDLKTGMPREAIITPYKTEVIEIHIIQYSNILF